MVDAYEVRTADLWPDADFEVRAASDGMTLEGYAAVFGKPSLPMAFPGFNGGRRFREVIHPGAFADSLAGNPDVTLRFQHDMTALPLARTRAGTMELAEDATGLRVRASLPDNEWGRPVRDAIARGDIAGMSFRFRSVEQTMERTEGEHVRHLHKVELGPEVSVTDIPAYPDTVAAVRHLADAIDVEPDLLFEAFRALRDDEAELTGEQRRLLMEAINAKSGPEHRVIPASVARRMEALIALR